SQRSPAERAAPSLTLPHDFYAALVFPPAIRGILADFPSIRVDAHGSVQDGSVAQRGFRVVARARDGPSANHLFTISAQRIAGRSPSRERWWLSSACVTG